ncbi:ABC transporter ATP-binding protein [Cellulomonas chitinilytica]|uniref:ABC transporter ATP-binding protein n=1 Tax=Cellulomonas chitinilytica TaxID=398759 RepID=A0A919P162_9CELL|nr:ABC transporter ATP-binding protein [Cellulomonas chitinilytica]GIG21357.1 ABC transporter ATP-binding protein [Cellulomonas chitinilytica]
MTTTPLAGPDRLTARGLVKRFGETVALAGVDVSLAPGESLSVMGPSGSGKSTLLHCLAGILQPDAGDVVLQPADGSPLDLGSLGERRRSLVRRQHLGFVFQFGQLLSELTALENVALPSMLLGASRDDAELTASGWLGRLGLDGMGDRRPGELSGGQAQRVAVARALVTRPAVVFADEPTGALDQATGYEVMRLLTETTRAAGASLVVVTHDADVAAWCERRITVRDGLVVDEARRADGTAGAATVPAGAVPGVAADGLDGWAGAR